MSKRIINIRAKLIIDNRGMVTTDRGAKLFQITGDGVSFLDNKDRRRVSERNGQPCVCVSGKDLIELLSQHCVERKQGVDGGAAATDSSSENGEG